MYKEGAEIYPMYEEGCAKFHAGVFSLDNAPQFDSHQTEMLMENNKCYTMLEIANILKISKSSVRNYLYQLGYVHCFDVSVPHKSGEKSLLDNIS